MDRFSNDIATTIALVTVVFGLFIVSAIMRIKNARKELKLEEKPKAHKVLRKIDLVFSSIFLIVTIAIYIAFLFRIGH